MLTTADFEALMNSCQILQTLPDKDKEEVRRVGEVRPFKRGQVLRDRKGAVNAMVFLKKGLVRFHTCGQDGTDVMLFYVAPGQSCIMTCPRLCCSSALDYKAEVVEDSDIILLDEDLLRSFEESHPQVRRYVDNVLAFRLDRLFTQLASIVSDDLTERVMKYLIYMKETLGTSELSLTHKAISQDLNCRREVVTRILSHFQADGMISLGRNNIQILDSPLWGDIS